ncbi:hypothetical protein ACHAXT_004351 [Thalassiosira profunda]
MALLRLHIAAAAAVALAARASAFSPAALPTRSAVAASSTSLRDIIKGEAVGAESMDESEGGVGLAMRTAVRVSGVAGKGKEAEARELVRYEKMQGIDEAVAKSIMEKADCQLLCSGSGKELYQDPGSSMRVDDKVIRLAPIEAAKNALSSMASAVTVGEDAKTVNVNFLGGDELIVGEVLEACAILVEGLDFPAKTKVAFHSISYGEVPADVCSVTVVASAGKAGGLEGADASVARGELYVNEGKWMTVAEGDITTATN